MKAMVLCAGLGTRLRPVTLTTPKPLVTFFDRPIVSYTVEMLRYNGCNSLVINTHHLPRRFHEILGDSHLDIPIEYIHEPDILGAVGGVRNALSLFGDEPLVVINGDIILDVDISGLLARHAESGAALTLSTAPITSRPELNVVGIDDAHRVVRIRNSGSDASSVASFAANLGAYVYEPSLLRQYAPDGKPFGFMEDLIPICYERGVPIASFAVTSPYWNDIGDHQSFLAASRDALDGKLPRRFSDWIAYRNNYIGDSGVPRFLSYFDAKADPEANIGKYAVVNSGACVKAGAHIENCIVLPGATVEAGVTAINQIVS